MVALTHRTTYRYDAPVSLGPQVVRLHPAPSCRAPIPDHALTIAPKHHLTTQRDLHGNLLTRVIVPDKTRLFEVAVDLTADLTPINPFAFFVDNDVAARPFAYPDELARDLIPYLAVDAEGPLFDALVARFRDARGGTVAFLVDLNAGIRARIAYETRLASGTQTPEETLFRARGSCRDSAWLLVQLLRATGIAARFVSGYSIQLKNQEGSVKEDVAALHAWAEAWLPGAGWIGLDPVSGMMAAAGHIPLACAPHYGQAVPIEGQVYGGGRSSFDFAMTVRRLPLSPGAD